MFLGFSTQTPDPEVENDEIDTSEGEEDRIQTNQNEESGEESPTPTAAESACLQHVNSCLMITQQEEINWDLYYECYNNAIQSTDCQSGFGH